MLTRWAHRHAQWLFPAPAVLLVAVLIVYPIAYTGWMSFQEWSASSLSPPRFVGAANYTKILVGDARFREAVGRTIYFTLVAVAAETLLGVAMALSSIASSGGAGSSGRWRSCRWSRRPPLSPLCS